MRLVFHSIPYVMPTEPVEIGHWMLANGQRRTVKKGETLKFGGEANRLFFVMSGMCGYYVAEDLTGRPTIMSLLPAGRLMGDLTTLVQTTCYVETKAILDSTVVECSPVAFREYLASRPDLESLSMRMVLKKQESVSEGLLSNFKRSPEDRLKVLLKVLLLEAGPFAPGEGWRRLPFRLTDEVLGQVIELTRPRVSNLMSKWVKDGLLRREGHDREFNVALFEGIYDWKDAPDGNKPTW